MIDFLNLNNIYRYLFIYCSIIRHTLNSIVYIPVFIYNGSSLNYFVWLGKFFVHFYYACFCLFLLFIYHFPFLHCEPNGQDAIIILIIFKLQTWVISQSCPFLFFVYYYIPAALFIACEINFSAQLWIAFNHYS